MSKKSAVPNAWDDDWSPQAGASTVKSPQPEQPVKISKAARRAQHIEQQKQLWDTAENPARNLWLEAQGVVPLKQEFKAPMTLLSRKPQPAIARRDPTNGIAGLTLEDDEDDSEEEARKKRESELEERQRRAKIEREEKQRKYAEARERIMGTSAASPAQGLTSRESSHGRDNRRARNRGGLNQSSNVSSSTSPASQSPARSVPGEQMYFDPNDMGRRILKPTQNTGNFLSEGNPIRQPRGPDGTGRGGFGFASRGGGAVA